MEVVWVDRAQLLQTQGKLQSWPGAMLFWKWLNEGVCVVVDTSSHERIYLELVELFLGPELVTTKVKIDS